MKQLYLIILICLLVSSCKKDTFNKSKNSKDFFHIKNGDYAIPVLVRGNTSSNKIILFIQGGPGYSSLDFAQIDYPNWENSLEKDFAIAYYDQRGTGNSQGNFSLENSIINTWVDDLHKVAEFLEKAYDAEIIMMGHSFGGGLMYRYMIDKGQSGIGSKYIAIDAPVTTDSDIDTMRWDFRRQFLLNTAHLEILRGKRVNQWNEVIQWLNQHPKIRKIEGENPYKLMNQWNKYIEDLVYIDYPEKSIKFKEYLKIVFSSNYNPTSYLHSNYKNELITKILNEEKADLLINKLNNLPNVPILIIGGRFDDICPPEENTYVNNQLISSNKQLTIIDYAGHTPFIDQPNEFSITIKQFIQ